MLKLEYLGSLFPSSDLSVWFHSFGGPIISVLIFFFVLSKIELFIRKAANKITKAQIKEDQELKVVEINTKSLDNNEKDEEIRSIKIELDAKRAEIENIKLETEKKRAQLEAERDEMKNLKVQLENDESKKSLGLYEERDAEYEEALKIDGFHNAMDEIKRTMGTRYMIDTKYMYIYITYDLYREGGAGEESGFTDKGKYFLRKYILSNKETKIKDGISNGYSPPLTEQSDDDLPF